MKSVPDDSQRKKRSEDSTKEGNTSRERIQFPRNRIKEVIYCDFCGSLAANFAKRKDGKIVYCCEDCASVISREAKWFIGSVGQC